MDFDNIFLLLAAVIHFFLGFFILIKQKEKKSLAIRYYFLMALSLSLWSVFTFFFLINSNFIYDRFFLSIIFILGGFSAFFLFYFLSTFPSEEKISTINYALPTVLLLLVIYFSYFSDFIWQDIIVLKDNAKFLVFHPIGYWFYLGFLILIILKGILTLLKKYNLADKLLKKQIFYIIIGTVLGGLSGVFFSLVFTIVFPLSAWGPIATLILVVFIAYAIAKHHIFNIKVIATELLTFLVWIAILIEVFLADTLTEMLIEIGLLIFVVFFGILLIRSVLREIRIREKIESLVKELGFANKRLKEIDDQKTEFMSLASHQLRTPLTSIKGYTSMVKSGDFGKISNEQKEPLDIIFTSTENMNNLIDDFLNASRIERKKGFDYNFVVDNPINLIKGIIDNLSIQAKEKGIKFVYENKINKEVKIKFDNRTLLQAISNLIQNAIKYTNNGSVTVKISRTNNHLGFSVKDSGIGMSKEDLKMLFKRFFRSDSVKINHPEGTGLGLYLAERIILDHGGKIWAESKGIGKGSSFFITLPVVNE